MNITTIKTLGQLKKSGYVNKSIKEEVRNNLIKKLKSGEQSFTGILGYENTVIPDTERAILSRHNMLFLGLRGQAKTRLARQMVDLLDDYIPIVEGSELNDCPFSPISKYARDLVSTMGDETPIAWLNKIDRYGEKLATPDVSVADLIGDIDPIKAANLKLSFADEGVLHYGIIPRSNRSIFVINELPDLQPRIQVALFNILQEGDIQIRGFKLRLPLDILFVFTANPEDYTNRGSIVTPLKDRIESQILTHYPKELETALQITQQEADILQSQKDIVTINDLVKRIIEQIAFEARSNELVDKKSGVSARLTIAAFENAVSSAERRAIIHQQQKTIVWISDIVSTIPAITGKIELLYEGEQEGPYQVAIHLIDKAIRAQFIQHFPNPETFKKKRVINKKSVNEPIDDSPYKPILNWFDKGNEINLFANIEDSKKIEELYKVDGLYDVVKRHYNNATVEENALFMEFILHGLSSFSLISKKTIDNVIVFKDLMGSMINFDEDTNKIDEEDL